MIDVWEKSVRATHHFVTATDLERIKKLVHQIDFSAFSVYCLMDQNEVVGFLGVADATIESLFLHPDLIGQGHGRRLVKFAFDMLKADKVNVNEQNVHAVAFYSKLGFKTYERTDKDPEGNDYPILKMKLTG